MEKKFNVQVEKSLYYTDAYLSRGRWNNYWHQINNVRTLVPPKSHILEIGKGNGLVSLILKEMGFNTTTIDIDASLSPDIVGSVIDMPITNKSYDLVIAAEILEHLPIESLPKALSEIKRISRKFAVISLPHKGVVFKLVLKLPLIKEFSIFFKIPYFWKKHNFDGQHYWDIGKRHYQLSKIRSVIKKSGMVIIKDFIDYSDPSHWHCVVKINP
jgi:hypothetical protein